MRDELTRILATTDAEVAGFFESMGETERRTLAPMVISWYQAWNKAGYGSSVQGIAWKTLCDTIPVALYATATLSELKKARCWIHDQEVLLSVWGQRRPPWLAEWAAWSLDQNPGSWKWVRAMEKLGWLERPPQESYWMGMIRGADREGALALLDRDPELRDLVWHLFEVEGKGENSLAAFDKYCSEEKSWSHALLSLSARGVLARERLLRASLEALALDFEAFRAGWFSRFHEALQPSLRERGDCAGLYAGLLSSRIRPTQSMALKALGLLLKAGQLSWAEQARSTLPAALLSSDKGTALAALKLALQLPGEQPAELAAIALDHAHAEVQSAALQALRKLLPRPDPARWRSRGDHLAASLQPVWREWLGAPMETVEVSLVTPGVPARSEEILACGDLDEVIQLAARMLESPDPPWEAERLLDGMLRFPRPTGPSTQAIAKRARQKAAKTDLDHRDLAQTVLCWLEPESPLPQPSKTDVRGFLTLRLREVAQALVQGRSSALVSLPEQPCGLLRLSTLQERLRQVPDPLPWDLHQARARAYSSKVGCPGPLAVEVNRYEQFTHRKLSIGGPRLSADFLEMASLHQQSSRGGLALLRWQSTLWPAGREWWAAQGLEEIANNVDWWEANWGQRAYLESLLFPLPWGHHSRLLLAFGLACKQAEQAGLAVDAALLALSQGDLTGLELGQALVEVAATGMVKGNRWARTLAEVGNAQPLAVWEAVQGLVSGGPPDFDLGPLLPLLWELCHQLRRPPEAARPRLEGYSGSGKAATLARKLAALAF